MDKHIRSISSILIANRGEIALRVIRACKEAGLRSIAVYSDSDKRAMHVRMADEAVRIGEPPPNMSYLNQEAIIAAAKQSGADAIHPGYGFLSENAGFAQRVRDEGLIFIGPPPSAMSLLGDKTAARALAAKLDVPVAPGTIDPIVSPESAIAVANSIGYPVLIKAAGGGGGKGMRVVHSEAEFITSVESAQREANSAFGDGRVFIEKYFHHPKHIEFQILADEHGNCIHLGERECSVQRRHQKVIEESPSPSLTPELRARMGETACALIRAAGYTNAGTVEFLLDEHMNFYFLEVNARLQVEHPVTELVTGIDLVREQIAIAEGAPLRFAQSDIIQRGWAIECRIIAENPMNGFMPSSGTIVHATLPQGIGVRNDSVIENGMIVPPYYDSLLGKLIVHAETRERAIERARRALDEYLIAGVATSIPFCKFALEHDSFISGAYNTGFVETYFTIDALAVPVDVLSVAAAAAVFAREHEKPALNSTAPSINNNRWTAQRFDFD